MLFFVDVNIKIWKSQTWAFRLNFVEIRRHKECGVDFWCWESRVEIYIRFTMTHQTLGVTEFPLETRRRRHLREHIQVRQRASVWLVDPNLDASDGASSGAPSALTPCAKGCWLMGYRWLRCMPYFLHGAWHCAKIGRIINPRLQSHWLTSAGEDWRRSLRCQIECQKKWQTECQIDVPDRMSNRMPDNARRGLGF